MGLTQGALDAVEAQGARGESPVKTLATSVCLSYAQLLFSRSASVGALLLLATACVPRMFVAGLASVALALGLSRALRLSPEQSRSGHLAFSALLVGLGGAAFGPATVAGGVLVAVAVLAAVLVTVSVESALSSTLRLPALTLPFLLVFYAMLGALGAVALPRAPLGPDPWTAQLTEAPGAVATFLQSLGSLLFMPRIDVGALVLAALVWHSRVAAGLAVGAFALTTGVLAPALGLSDTALVHGLALNAMLIAVGLGAVWFIPSPGSYVLALLGIAVAAGLELALAPSRTGVPALIVPFNLTALLVLFTLKHRVSDGSPHFVDFAAGTPEQNLAYFRSRKERFGAVHGLRFAAPFRGRWTCTQGVSGGVTHEGPWRHALDFEVLDDDASAHRDGGTELADFYCYRLPVLAVAAGTVAKVVDGVRDNAPGEVNLDDNWGNVVVLYHAPGVYSCVAHLAPGSITVREGQHVAAGEVLGRCGNSGRSASPHVHLQLQATAHVGAATLPLALHDVVDCTQTTAPALRAAHVPRAGETVRNLAHDAERAKLLRFEYASALTARVEGPRGPRTERLVPDLDLLGRHLLRSREGDAVLYYEPSPAAFTVHDVVGDEGSVLHAMRVALSRVPCDADESLAWSDELALRPFLPVWLRPLFDLAAPLGAPGALTMRYVARREGQALVIEGASNAKRRDGSPRVTSRAVLTPGAGLVRFEVRASDSHTRVEIEPKILTRNAITPPTRRPRSQSVRRMRVVRAPSEVKTHTGPTPAPNASLESRPEGGVTHG